MATAHNFLLAAKNTAQLRGTATSTLTETDADAANLLDEASPHLVWMTKSTCAADTEVYITYPTAQKTRAIILGGGSIPLFGTTARYVRGYNLTPMMVLWKTQTAATNATGSIDRTKDPRVADGATFIGPTSGGSDWSVTLDFATPEFGFDAAAYQKLVIRVKASEALSNAIVKVEVKNQASAFVDYGSVTVTDTGFAVEVISIRLTASQISTPAEVRISGAFVSTGNVELHGLAFVGPVQPSTEALRLTGAFLATAGTVTGSAAQTRHNPLDDQVAEDEGIVLADAGTPNEVRVALDADPRIMSSATLKFSWKPGDVSDTLQVKLWHEGTLEAVIGVFTTASTDVQMESLAVSLAGLPENDGIGLELQFLRDSGTGPTTISGVAWHPVFESIADIETYDSGFLDIKANASSQITGDEAIDNLGRSSDIPVTHNYRNVTDESLEVRATESFVEFDVTASSADADIPLTLALRIGQFIAFRYLFEGPGLAGMQLQKGIKVDFHDTSITETTMGGIPFVVKRRIARQVAFELGKMPVGIGPEQVGALLHRVGNSEPVLFIVLPQEPGLENLFSIYGLIQGKASVAHEFGTRVAGTITILEI